MATPTPVASNYVECSTGSSASFSLNCGTGSNRCVFVTVTAIGAGNTVSSLTVGGQACTLVATDVTASGWMATYKLLSPATGIQTVSVTFSAGNNYATIGADSWSDVNQSTPNGSVVSSYSDTNTTPSTTITGTTAGNVVRAAAWLYYAQWNYAAGQTGIWINKTQLVYMGGVEYTAAGGSKTMTWTGEQSRYIQQVFEIMASVSAPSNSVAPAVTGTAQVGQTLTTTDGTWTGSPTSYSYQWQRADDSGFTTNVTSIGSNQNTFTLTVSESGKYVRCQVTATNAGGSATANGTQITVAAAQSASRSLTLTGVG